MRSLCLDHLTLSKLTALEMVEVANEVGCGAVSLFVKPLPLGPYRDLVKDRSARAEVLGSLRDKGMRVGIIEPFMIEELNDWEALERTVDLAAELGGRVNALGFDQNSERLHGNMQRLAEFARGVGVEMTIEAFPLSAVRTQAEALELAVACGSHVGLCVDTLHVVRSGGDWQDVARLPPERIFHVQLNDAPRDPPADRYREATIARLLPGQGEFDLASLMPLIPRRATLAVEAPFIAPENVAALEQARVVVEATRRLIEE